MDFLTAIAIAFTIIAGLTLVLQLFSALHVADRIARLEATGMGSLSGGHLRMLEATMKVIFKKMFFTFLVGLVSVLYLIFG